MRGHHGAAVFAACVAALAPPPQHRVSSRRARLAPLCASGAIERVWPEASRALDLLREAADDDDVEPGATYVDETARNRNGRGDAAAATDRGPTPRPRIMVAATPRPRIIIVAATPRPRIMVAAAPWLVGP